MFNLRTSLITVAVLISTAAAQSPAWGQCGGIGWSGPTTCVSGYACVASNPYYSQCIPGTGSPTTSSGGSTPTTITANTDLHSLAKSKGKVYFGSATDNPELSDTAYVNYLSNANMFGQITPGNALKWDATEPSRGNFNFNNADTIVNLAKKNGQILRGSYHIPQLPSWVSSGNFDSTTLTSILQNHCSTVVGKYKGEICAFHYPQTLDSWDVVNEAFNEDGTFRTFVLYNTLGKSYIDIALQAARAADPNTKLYINDYNIEGLGAKSTGMYNLVKDLKSRNIPIDGIGMQAHLIVGSVPTTIQQNIEQFTSLGVEVAITELDIRMDLPATQDKLEQQQKDYQAVIGACMAVKGCVGVTIWDYTDKYSWIPSVFSGQGAALPWDENLNPKPAYEGIVAGFQG
ncbi:hypothetical protein VNI00_003854 [Paramarasmius palmivorus]|uniref:Beta-xylanase n=1 Tax=Paramarasmius palmivorus TaxID=297713 RepID=A0AAW0DP94_9AGAR